MKNKLIIKLFLCLALIQVVVPLSMIVQREIVLKQGTQFKFKVAPVDPYDAFRGRYVALRIEESSVPKEKGMELSYGQTVYAFIEVDAQGFAKLTRVAIKRPLGKAYIQATVNTHYGDKIDLNLLINRYYMEEKAALLAEKVYQQHTRGVEKDAYVSVKIKDGFAVIDGLYVGGQRIEEAIKHENVMQKVEGV
jgi:uncharacterized membrane-anchored protein